MPATRSKIIAWYTVGEREGASHMFIITNLYDHEDYPVFIHLPQDPVEEYERLHDRNMQAVVEVYSFYRPLAPQLNEPRAFHLD